MTSETSRLKAKLSTLSDSLDNLESKLEPLFAQTLPESVVSLDTIQQAKLQTVLPYLVYDLVFIYLKSRGIDPKTHAVYSELDRVRQYFEKITNAEESSKKKVGIDKAAANRFIKHAIAQATYGKQTAPADPTTEAGPSKPDARVPVKVTSKMLERAEYEKNMKDADDEEEEEDGLEVFDEAPEEGDTMEVEEAKSIGIDRKGKGKQKAEEGAAAPEKSQTGSKRRRPAMDPFAGYGDEEPVVEAVPPPDTPNTVKRTKTTLGDTGRDELLVDAISESASGRSTPASGSGKKRRSKKEKRKGNLK